MALDKRAALPAEAYAFLGAFDQPGQLLRQIVD
jgi:hypothetical protein